MDDKPPLQKLHVRLLKEDARQMGEALDLEDGVKLKEYKLKSSLNFSGKLYVSVPKQSVPRWFAFVETGTEGELDDLKNRTNAAVLMIKRSARIFALTFGHGRHLIKQSAIVSDFGLKVALNGLEHNNLRSLDSVVVEEQTIHRRTQASRSSGIGAFGLDVGRDILRAVTGTPRQDAPASIKSMSGSEGALAVSAHVDFPGLGALCTELLTLYGKRTYRQNFPWVDNISRVRDPQLSEELDRKLLDDLRKGDGGSAYLAPPESIDWSETRGFSYTHNRDTHDTDLSVAHYLGGIEHLDHLTRDQLQRDKVFVFDQSDEVPTDKWQVYKCLVFETTRGGRRFVLSGGEWFEISQNFAAGIRMSLKAIKPLNLGMPKVNQHSDSLETEPDYNKRVGESNKSMAVLDRTIVKCESAPTGIEPCDLLSDAGDLIFVKHRKGGSSSLSHLFAQARVASEAFLGDETFRKGVRSQLHKLNVAWEKRVPESRPDASKFQTVLAILGVKDDHFLENLPFFSQLNLVRTVRAILNLGLRVGVTGIEATPPK